MGDIVERLRERHAGSMNSHGHDLRLLHEAANEIECLRRQRDELLRTVDLAHWRESHNLTGAPEIYENILASRSLCKEDEQASH